MHQLRFLWLGALRVVMSSGAQLPLRPVEPEWQLLDQRERGTAFIAINSRSVLNPPATTGRSGPPEPGEVSTWSEIMSPPADTTAALVW